MLTSYAHDADTCAPGAAITVALCGQIEHEPPCPLAPHHTAAAREGQERLRLRVLFAAEPELGPAVRRHIVDALSAWPLLEETPSDVSEQERTHAGRIAAS